MKIIILFALASVGVCTESESYDPPPPKECSTSEPYPPTFDRCDDFVNEYANDDNCMRHALESVPQLLEIAKKLICKGRKNKLDKSSVYYAGFEKELKDFMGCTGCFADKTLGVKEILGHLGAAVGGVVGISVKIIVEIIHGTGLINPALDLTCDLLTGDLTSECAEMISNSDLTSKAGSLRSISSVRKRRCRLDNSLGTEDTLSHLPSKTGSLRICSVAEIETQIFEGIDKILEDLGCLLEDSPGIKATLSDLTSKRSISSLAEDDTLDLKELLKFLEVVGCVLDNSLGIKDTLTNVTPDIGEALHSLIKPLLNRMLEKPGIGDLVAGMKCPW